MDSDELSLSYKPHKTYGLSRPERSVAVRENPGGGGDGGIRTLGTLIEYGSLAGNWFQPLTHVSAARVSAARGAL